MATIGEKTLNQAADMVRGLLLDYEHQIDMAYCDCENDLKVGLSVKFSPNGSGTETVAEINFVKERVKDKQTRTIDENQQELPFDEKRDSWHEILFRNFDDLREILKASDIQRRWKQTGLLFKRF